MAINTKPDATQSKLQEFFLDQLKDIYWAENKMIKALKKMQSAATTESLKNVFEDHLKQTQTHISRLDTIFQSIGEKAESKKCLAMAGIMDEANEIIDETEEGTAQRDVGLIFAAQKAEHYEIATYGGLLTLSQTLGYKEAAEHLSRTLNEEKEADAILTGIATDGINLQARKEPANA